MKIYSKKLQTIIAVAPFVQMLFCLAFLNTTSNFFNESTVFYIAFVTCFVALLLILIAFFRIAKKTVKIGLLIYMPFILILFMWHNGMFDNISTRNIKSAFKSKDYFEVLVNVGDHPFDNVKFYIDIEQSISANPYVDSVFLIGLDELKVSVLGFSVNERVCDAMGISIAEPVWFIDSIMTLSPPAHRYYELDTLKFRGISIKAFLGCSCRLEDYKKNLIIPRREDDCLAENEVIFLVYCLSKKQEFIEEKLVAQFDSLKQFLPHDVKMNILR